MADIDSLEIEISAESTRAAERVNSLAQSLERLGQAVQNSRLGSISKSIQGLGEASTPAEAKVNKRTQMVRKATAGAKEFLGQKIIDASISSPIQSASKAIEEYRNELDFLNEAKINGPIIDASVQKEIEHTTREVEVLKSALEEVSSKKFTIQGSGISKLSQIAKNGFGKIQNGFHEFIGKEIKNFSSGINSVGNIIGRQFIRPLENATTVFSKWKKSLGRLAFYRMANEAIRTVSDGIKAGINNLYQYSSLVGTQFAPAMNSLATSSQYLKNSLGSMAAPLIQAVAPAVDYLIDKFVALLNIIGKVFAALMGKSSYTQATRVATSYGDAIGGVGDAAGGAAKALNDYMLGIDELNVISDTSGGGGLDFGSMFEEVEIPTEIADFAARIMEAIEQGNWMGAGGILAEKMNQVVASWDSEAFGRKLAEAVNHGIEFSYGFLRIFEGETLGSKIAQAANGFVENVKSAILGRAAGAFQNLKFDVVIGFSTTFNWEGLGEAMSNFVNGFVNQIDPEKAAEAVNTTLRGILKAATTFFEKTDWSALGETIGSFLANIQWVDIFGESANLVADAIIAMLKTAGGMVAAGLEGQGDSIFGNAVSVAAGLATTLITASFVGGLLETLGTKLSQMSATKKILASTILVAIEFAVNEWSIKKFIETGDIKNLGINLFSTAASSFLLYKMWGTTGLAIGIGVAIAANVTSIATKIAEGVSWNDPSVIISSALTMAIGGIGGAIIANKAGISGGAGFVIGITLALAAEISTVNFAQIASGNIAATDAQSIFSSVISSALIGVAGASLAMATGIVTGGVGFAIGLAVGVILNIVSIAIAQEEHIKSTIREAINKVVGESNGGIPIDELGLKFEMLAQAVGNSFSSMNTVDLEGMNSTITTASSHIGVLIAEAKNSVISMGEAADSINSSFTSIADTIEQKFSGTREMLLSGLYGPFQQISEMLGIEIPALETLIISATTKGEEGARQAKESISALSEQLGAGEISLEKYTEEVQKQYDALLKLGDVNDGVSDVVTNFNDYMDSLRVDLSGIVDETGVNTQKLSGILGGMNDSYTSSIDDITKYTDDYVAGWQLLINSGTLTADQIETAQDAIGASLKIKDQHIAEMQQKYGRVIDATQTELIGGLEGVVQNLEDKYQTLSPFEKWFTTESEFVKQGLEDYKANNVDPVLKEIQDGMNEIGIQGEPWADEAMQKIMDALFPTEESTMGRAPLMENDLKAAISSALEGVKTTTVPEAEGVGQNIMEGLGNGVTGTSTDKLKTGFEAIVELAKDVYQTHSPSKVFEEIGKFLPAGLAQGVESGWGDVDTIFQQKSESMTTGLSNTWEEIKKNTSLKWGDIKTSLGNVWDGLNTTATTTWTSLKNTVHDGWEKAQTSTTTIWDSVGTWLDTKWNTISTTESGTFEAIRKDISDKWDSASTDTDTKWASMESLLKTTWDGLTTASETGFSAIASHVKTNWENAEEKTTTSWNAQKTLLDDIWAGLKTNADIQFDLMYAAVDTNWTSAQTLTDSSWKAQDSLLRGVWSGLQTTSETAFNAMYTSVNTAWTDSSRSTSDEWKSMVTTTTEKAASALKAVTDNFKKVSGEVTGGLTNARTAAKDVEFASVGRNAVEGISSGIRAKVESLKNSMVNGILAAKRAAESAAGIHSPSTLFRDDVGVYIGLGVAEGITYSIRDIVASIYDVNAQMKEAFDPSILESPQPLEFPVHEDYSRTCRVEYSYDAQHEEDTAQRLSEGVKAGNEGVIEALYAGFAQLLEAVNNQDNQPRVYLDGKEIMQSTERHQRARGANILAGGVMG